jgi:hypothetical protein
MSNVWIFLPSIDDFYARMFDLKEKRKKCYVTLRSMGF